MQPSNSSQDNQNPIQQPQQQQVTTETIEQFNKVCEQATELMLSYKQQSQDLKNEITSMVTLYNKTANPNDAVPVEKIIQITNSYETQMKQANNEYLHLQNQLKKQQKQRNDMMKQIEDCFGKLQRMQKIISQKKSKGNVKLTQSETNQNVNHDQ